MRGNSRRGGLSPLARVALAFAILAATSAIGARAQSTAQPQPAAPLAAPTPVFDLGRTPSATALAHERGAILPDGTGLPPGRGSVAQGARIYETRCANCHDTPAFPQLWGGVGSLARLPQKTVGSYWPYATTLFDYVSRAMPPAAPKPLSANDVYAVSAYILSRSDIVPASAVLDRATLPRVKMPNRDGFVVNDGKPDL